eukprot:jgi/Botrbrau1/14297/Bobra.0207s0002.1
MCCVVISVLALGISRVSAPQKITLIRLASRRSVGNMVPAKMPTALRWQEGFCVLVIQFSFSRYPGSFSPCQGFTMHWE